MTIEYKRLGPQSAELVLYLPNRPTVFSGDPEAPDISQLITDNGNHWRKIFSILAKIQYLAGPWQSYRDQQLLQHAEAISFDNQLVSTAGWHIAAGKQTWERLKLSPEDGFRALDDSGRCWVRDQIILTPYFDYRQLPNELCQQIRGLIWSFS